MNPPDQGMQDCELNKQLKRARLGLCQAAGAMQLAVLWGVVSCLRHPQDKTARKTGPLVMSYGSGAGYLSVLADVAAAAAFALTFEISSIRKSRNTAMRFE